MKEKVPTLLSRLDLIKNLSEHSKLLNDCFDVIMDLHSEVVRLEKHNQRLLQVIYQNQSELETINEPTKT